MIVIQFPQELKHLTAQQKVNYFKLVLRPNGKLLSSVFPKYNSQEFNNNCVT